MKGRKKRGERRAEGWERTTDPRDDAPVIETRASPMSSTKGRELREAGVRGGGAWTRRARGWSEKDEKGGKFAEDFLPFWFICIVRG